MRAAKGHRYIAGAVRTKSVLAVLLALTAMLWSGDAYGSPAGGAETGAYQAVVLDNDVTCTISAGGAEETRHVTVKILNAEGRWYSGITIEESRLLKLRNFTATVYDAAGKELSRYREKDAWKYCGFDGYVLYADVCKKQFDLSAGSYPFTVDYQYTLAYQSLMFWSGWSPQRSIPVQHARYTLITPKDFTYAVKTIGAISSPTTTEKGNDRISVWEMTDIPAIKDEDCATPYMKGALGLAFAPSHFTINEYGFDATDWNSLGRGVYEMMRTSLALGNDQAALVDDLSRDAASPAALWEDMCRTLSPKMRYVAVEVGIGGWQPHLSEKTYSVGYGDCKDLATMYVSMLRRADINAVPALLRIRGDGDIDPSLPAINRFNHVIYFVVMGNDTIWADPTCTFCGPGDLPRMDENVSALAVDSAGAQIVRTPSSTPDENTITRRAVVTVNADKSISAAVEFTVTGNPRHWLINNLSATEKRDQAQLFRDDVLGISPALTIDSFSCPAAGDYSSPLAARVYGRMKNGVLNAGNKWYVNVEFLSPFSSCETADFSVRTHGLDLKYPKRYCDSFVITIPSFWTAGDLPGDTAVSDNFGSVSRSYRLAENQLLVVQERRSFDYDVSPERLVDFQKHVNIFQDILAGHIALYEKK
jgi:hypothetical protein